LKSFQDILPPFPDIGKWLQDIKKCLPDIGKPQKKIGKRPSARPPPHKIMGFSKIPWP
jgi:hypothetical protein